MAVKARRRQGEIRWRRMLHPGAIGAALALLLVTGGVSATATAADSVTTVSGRIVGSDGEPMAGVSVAATARQGYYGDEPAPVTTSASDGTFTLSWDIDISYYRVMVEPVAPYVQSHVTTSGGLAWGEYGPAARTFPHGGAYELGDLELIRGTTMSGTVAVSGLSRETTAYLGIRSLANDQEISTSIALQNGANPWQIAVPSGSYTAQVGVGVAGLHSAFGGTTPTPIVVDGAGVTGIDMELESNGRVIDGTMLDPDGRASTGIRVGIRPATGNDYSTSRTAVIGASGAYALENVVPGEYRVVVDGAGAGDSLTGYWQEGSATPVSLDEATVLQVTSSTPSRTIDMTLPRPTSSEPREVVAVAGDAQAVVSWQAPASPGIIPVHRYVVTAHPGGASVTVPDDHTSATVSGLSNGTAYTFTVVAQNWWGASPVSSASAAVTPAAEPAPPVVESTVVTRCIGSTVTLSGRVLNTESTPISVVITSAYSTKTFASVAPGTWASFASTTRAGSVPAGAVEVTATRLSDGVSVSSSVAYDGRSCS